MTVFRSCVGCVYADEPCAALDRMKESLRGLRVTSVKWRCEDRRPRFEIGDQVWAETYSDYGRRSAYGEDDGGTRANYPAVVIEVIGSKAVVFIEKDAPSQEFDDDYPFTPNGNGFCKIPLYRLKPRDGERETICKSCSWPERLGHQPGFICHHEIKVAAQIAAAQAPTPSADDEDWPF